jgi:hypothetical protein
MTSTMTGTPNIQPRTYFPMIDTPIEIELTFSKYQGYDKNRF